MIRLSHFTRTIVGLAMSLTISLAAAQDHQSHDHGGHTGQSAPADPVDHSGHVLPSTPAPADHSAHVAPSAPAPADHSAYVEPVDHSAHGASTAANPALPLRDPHAYAGGLTLASAPYGLPGNHTSHMADGMKFLTVKMDRLEWAGSGELNTEGLLAYGDNFDKLHLDFARESQGSGRDQGQVEFLWAHAVAPFWDARMGVRSDFGHRIDRQWLGLGVHGLAPYWLRVDVTAYLGEGGHSEVQLESAYDMLFTQRLILEPRLDLGWRGRSDLPNGVAQGWTAVTAGLRLRYEFSRQFAPYLGIEFEEHLAGTRDLLPRDQRSETRWVAGIHFWF